MERNKVTLLMILGLLLVSIFLGLYSISGNPGRHSKIQGQKFLKDGLSGAILIKIEGEIHSGRSTYSSTGADTVLARLREIENKPEIKGILLEINSPGGTVGASQEIYEELIHLRKDKKIVVSMKDLAASGGYYIASAADYIYAQHGTITGSIGVITMSPNISGLLEKANIKMKVYKAGKYKDILSMFREHTKEEVEIIDSLLDDTYRRFILDIAKGRNISKEKIELAAEGKIFSGEKAIKYHLVDAIGGRREAMLKLSELAGYDGVLPLFEDDESPIDRLIQMFGAKFSMLTTNNPMHMDIYKSPILLLMPSALRF